MVKRILTDDEREQMYADVDMADEITKKYQPNFEGTYTAELLDFVFDSWLKDKSTVTNIEYDIHFTSKNINKPTALMVWRSLGSAFGELLNLKYEAKWVHITDEYGEEIAINCKGSDMLMFPYSSIQKRIESKESYFFVALEKLAQSNSVI